jgi:hypothetical protein
MKNIISLALILCLCFSQITLVEGNTALIFQAANVLPGGDGVGFYDSNGEGVLEMGANSVCLRPTEWVRYDISSVHSGIYKLSAYASNTGQSGFRVYLADTQQLLDFIVPPTGDYDVFAEVELGYIYLPENADTLTFLNSSTSAMYFNHFALDYQAPASVFQIEAEDVISDIPGVGFYDNGLQPNYVGVVEAVGGGTGTIVCLRKGEWLRYDISSLPLGTYNIKASIANTSNTNLDVLCSGKLKISGADVASTTSYGIFRERSLGYLYKSQDEQTITLKNCNVYGTAMYIDYFVLEQVSDQIIFEKKIKVDSRNVVSQTPGEGYHDEAGESFTHNNMVQGGSVILHAGDWTRYDATLFETGLYSVRVRISNKAATSISVSVNESTQLKQIKIDAGGEYSNYRLVDLGNIYISEDATGITFLNSGNGSVYFNYFEIKYISSDLNDFYKKKIQSKNVLPGGHGVGFFDSDNEEKLEQFTQGVVLRPTEWTAYDVSAFYKGKYKVSAVVANKYDAKLSIDVDDVVEIESAMLPSTDEYSNYACVNLGYVVLMGTHQALKIINSASSTMYIKSLTLEIIPMEEELYYSSDVEGFNVVNKIGGHQTVYLSGSIINRYYPADSVHIFTALFNDKSQLINCLYNTVTVPIGVEKSISSAINITDDTEMIKSYVWGIGHSPLLDVKAIFTNNITEIYVSPTGSDENDGTLHSAFKSIQRAREYVRSINDNMYGNIIVNLEGEYVLSDTLEFTKEDSGTNGFSVIYKGNGETIISGGRKIGGWSRQEGTPLWKTTVSGADDIRQLYINGNRAARSRSKWLYWPADQYINPSGKPI